MGQSGIIFAGSSSSRSYVFYYLIPFLIVAGGSDSLAKLRPFLISGSVLFVVVGFYHSSKSRHSKSERSGLSMAVLWFSAVVVFLMILSPETIANVLANTVGG